MQAFVLECCVDSVESALAAQAGGATRLELCGHLPIGGVTPSLALYRQLRTVCSLPVRILLRPRCGDFLYTPHELAILQAEAALFAQEGADGIVLGCLTPDGRLDAAAMRKILAEAPGLPATLHRAFDLAANPQQSLEQAIALGCDTILTSGQQANAQAGKGLICQLLEQAQGRVDILIGAGVTPQVVAGFLADTPARCFHLSAKEQLESGMAYRKPGVPMGLPGLDEYTLWRTQASAVAQARCVLERHFA